MRRAGEGGELIAVAWLAAYNSSKAAMRREFSSDDELIAAAQRCIEDSRHHIELFRQSLRTFHDNFDHPRTRGGGGMAAPISANTPRKASLMADILFMELVLKTTH
jgi:hypothetical protein